MQSKVKLTKRQVKEDKFTTFMLTTKTQITENWQFYVIGLVAVIVLVAAAVWYVNHESTAEVDAAKKLSDAVGQYQSGNNQVAILALNQVIDNYGGTTSARTATYILAGLYLSSRSYDDAVRMFQKYLDDYKDNQLERAAAFAGIAAAHEGQASFAQAAEYFVKAVGEYPDGPLEADYRCGAVRNFIQAGDLASAKVQVDTLKEKHGGTESARRAERLFAETENQKS